MIYLSRCVFIILFFASCNAPKFTAKTKTDLSKLCVYEFPYSHEPITQKIDTLVINNVIHKRIAVDCDTIGIKEVDVVTEKDTVFITKTETVKDTTCLFYAQSLEAQNNNLTSNLDKAKTDYKQAKRRGNWLLLLVVGVGLLYVRLWLRK